MAILLLFLLALVATPAGARVDAERAVERARYAFVIGATTPFDELYPRSVFEQRVQRELAEEGLLQKLFGLSPTTRNLAYEFDRIEQSTRAPEQWAAIKQALGNDRRVIEDVLCRPIIVARVLRARFAFDPGLHAAAHQEARRARALLLSGRTVPGAAVLLLRRRAITAATTAELLQEAKARAALPRMLPAAVDKVAPAAPLDLDQEVATVLETQFRRPGDVTTILETRNAFTVYRLILATEESWKVRAVVFRKVNFETWFVKQPQHFD